MIRDYQIVSPSLDGILRHGSVSYDGVVRPSELLRVLDGPSSKGLAEKSHVILTDKERHVLEEYFHDMYGVFMKHLSTFIVGSEILSEEEIKLQAMLQEMIKIKRLMTVS